MSAPKRVQMTRNKPWRADNPDAVIVDRRTKWGNPFLHAARRLAVHDFREMAVYGLSDRYPTADEIRSELRGKDLACWCPLDQPCHADVLLELANEEHLLGTCPTCEAEIAHTKGEK